MIGSSLYDRHSSFYDAFHGTYVADQAFYIKQVKTHGGPVLELACGTGRLGMFLSSVSPDYTGLDASEGMLDLFRKKWAEAGRPGEPRLHQGDMRDFTLGRTFGLVLITFNSLQHIYRDEDVLRTLRCCRRHLAPTGRLIFDVFNPDRRILERDPTQWYPVSKFLDEERGDWCEVVESNRYDPDLKVNFIQWRYRYEKGESGTFRLEMRQFFPQEIDGLVGEAGLRIVNKWGDFVGSGFSAASPRQVFECEAVR
jgi:SAM-dependent methyltransferase